jgi:bifunctional enzyme CysN/CysC
MPKEIFRITSAGSVDDGKSTILARLLLDTGSIYDDQLAKNYDPNKIADLLDGLESEQSQGITIDVAYRYFDSNTRRYQIADSPGHEQYTRNMATASAGSDALMLVVDAQVGLKPQTKHHLEIALRLGIREIIFAINKMDLVNFNQKKFKEISKAVLSHLESRYGHFPGINHSVIPVSGLTGANVVKKSSKLGWFEGKTLLEAFDALKLEKNQSKQTIISVQMIQRLAGGGRRYLGRVLSGEASIDQQLYVSNKELKITKLLAAGEETRSAKTDSAISFEVDRDLDIQRGDVLTSEQMLPHDQFEAEMIWLSEDKGVRGRKYLLNSNVSESNMSITKISSIDLTANSKQGEKSDIGANEIIRANISIADSMTLLPFNENFDLGRFTVISPETGQTVAVGTVNFALRRSENITKHDFRVSSAEHAELTGNKPKVIWFTGLSGSGKSTIANELSKELYKHSKPHYILDGDNLRFGLNRDLGFTEADRTENIRRTAETAKLMADAGLIVLVTLISPKEADRQMAKEIIGDELFTLVYVDTPLDICEQRDPKGLYKKARAGQIPNFTGIGAEFEEPNEFSASIDNKDDLETVLSFI